jgi:hypothetical protein
MLPATGKLIHPMSILRDFPLKRLFASAFFAVGLPHLQAQSLETTPVGGIVVNVPANTTTATVTAFSLPLIRSAVWHGPATAVSGATLSVALSSATAAIVNATPHFIQIQTGPSAGRLIDVSAASAGSITLYESATPYVAAGNKISIRPHATLGGLLGETNQAGLLGGVSDEVADEVLLSPAFPDPFAKFYFNTTREGWRMSTDADQEQAGVIFYTGEEVTLVRKGTEPLSLIFTGEVPLSPLLKDLAINGPEIGAGLSQSFKAWLVAHDLPVSSGTRGDPDADGVDNLREYAFGTDPVDNTSGPGGLVYTGSVLGGGTLDENGQPVSRVESTVFGRAARMLFIRRTDTLTGDLAYVVQFTSDNITWVDSSDTPVVLASDNLFKVVAVPLPAITAGKRTRGFRVVPSLLP